MLAMVWHNHYRILERADRAWRFPVSRCEACFVSMSIFAAIRPLRILPIFFSQRIASRRALTRNSDEVDEFWAGARGRRVGLMGGGDAMPNVGTGQVGRSTDRRRLKRARALLEMFEEDRGRRAMTVEELREWMGAQYTDQLQIRTNRRLYGIDAGIL
jgi:hypothetical protein